jgi:hypothetical protein
MTATFWIETVEHEIEIPVTAAGQTVTKHIIPKLAGQPAPIFQGVALKAVTAPRKVKVTSTQIQYSQNVTLRFAGLDWPHVSVATLVPAKPIPLPPSVWG